MTAYPCENRSALRPLPVFVSRRTAKDGADYVQAMFGELVKQKGEPNEQPTKKYQTGNVA